MSNKLIFNEKGLSLEDIIVQIIKMKINSVQLDFQENACVKYSEYR